MHVDKTLIHIKTRIHFDIHTHTHTNTIITTTQPPGVFYLLFMVLMTTKQKLMGLIGGTTQTWTDCEPDRAPERGKEEERRGRGEEKYWAGESTSHPLYKTYVTIKKRKYKGSYSGTFLQF